MRDGDSTQKGAHQKKKNNSVSFDIKFLINFCFRIIFFYLNF